MMMITCLILWIPAGTTYVPSGPTDGPAACLWPPDVHDASRTDMNRQPTAIRAGPVPRRSGFILPSLAGRRGRPGSMTAIYTTPRDASATYDPELAQHAVSTCIAITYKAALRQNTADSLLTQ